MTATNAALEDAAEPSVTATNGVVAPEAESLPSPAYKVGHPRGRRHLMGLYG